MLVAVHCVVEEGAYESVDEAHGVVNIHHYMPLAYWGCKGVQFSSKNLHA